MTRRAIGVALIVGICLTAGASSAWAQKTTAVGSFSGNFAVTPAPVTATIAKGKTKRFLIAHAVVNSITAINVGETCSLYFVLTANGIPFDNLSGEATHAEQTCDCANVGAFCIGCTASATASLDLDVAEANNPGLFKNQPVNVELSYDTNSQCVGTAGTANVVVEMVKK